MGGITCAVRFVLVFGSAVRAGLRSRPQSGLVLSGQLLMGTAAGFYLAVIGDIVALPVFLLVGYLLSAIAQRGVEGRITPFGPMRVSVSLWKRSRTLDE
jgi:hypothetical protein